MQQEQSTDTNTNTNINRNRNTYTNINTNTSRNTYTNINRNTNNKKHDFVLPTTTDNLQWANSLRTLISRKCLVFFKIFSNGQLELVTGY